MSITGELARARALMFAADEPTAKELLLSLMPAIEAADRDDQMLEVFAQLGEIYLIRSALDGVRECIRRIDDCLDIYASILAGRAPADIVAQMAMTPEDADHMLTRYRRRAAFLRTGVSAAIGDHEGAAQSLSALDGPSRYSDLDDEHTYLLTHARILCALALCDDDLHARSVPLWDEVLATFATPADDPQREYLWLTGALGYARFCIETGKVDEALPWLRRAEARAQARGWELATARAQLERAAVSWLAGDQQGTEALATAAYPEIARQARAHEVSRCWLYFGLTRLAAGALQAADECWGHAERHWRELGKPLHVHRILLQRSWIAIFRGRYDEARALIDQARECLDASPRSSWLQYARLDDQLGTVWRAEGLADLGFDAAGNPADTWAQAEARYRGGLGTWFAEPGTDQYRSGMDKLATAADLKLPAALAVDSVRYSITDADARASWAAGVAAPLLAGAFAVAWESQNPVLVGELIEYHSARGAFSVDAAAARTVDWARATTTAVPVLDVDELASVASGPVAVGAVGLIRLGPLPPLQMEPDGAPVLARYRELARSRYGRVVTADQEAWSTCP
ncbi:hypothetical protein [Mycolicibacterium sp. lyk4-40-TYG-92]|uniref:hypothetical protein n=1 Tax=Mycolicibacterium sp. lyk4-40-TYG-92 TaxID=3040295 RepID=UPI00254E930C|nr:hypothetical protein [Mycolicibacterium sp. lyk4-40-TYG-92]